MFGLRDKVSGIFRHTQCIGTYRTHRFTRQAAQAFGETPQCGEGALLYFGIEIFAGGESGGKPYRFAQSVQHVKLVAFDSRDLQPETVGPQINGGEDGLVLHYCWISRSISSAVTWRTSRPLTM